MAGRRKRRDLAVYCPKCGDVRGHQGQFGTDPETQKLPDGRVFVRGHFRAYMTVLQEFCSGGFADPVADRAP
jgi:hypothetical protein